MPDIFKIYKDTKGPLSENIRMENSEAVPPGRKQLVWKVIITFFLFASVFLFFNFFLSPPQDFPAGQIFTIEKGESLRSVSLKFKNESIIRSRLVFEAFVIIYAGESSLVYSDYLFEKKLPVYEIARRTSKGEHHIPQVKITIPEGFSNSQIAETLSKNLFSFDQEKFLQDASGKEGYLFPDTYFFFAASDTDAILSRMEGNYEKKIGKLQGEILASGKSEEDIITMASIIEKEAKGDDDRSIISGILWKRLSMNMPLQVDAALETYKTRGLPKSPIANPGLQSIIASLHPETSPYLYYLHDKKGDIHYAKSFSEHKLNINKYLK